CEAIASNSETVAEGDDIGASAAVDLGEAQYIAFEDFDRNRRQFTQRVVEGLTIFGHRRDSIRNRPRS
ncbi:hypothetical protein LTR94_033741, partial [Friedmanniomyces endolithicus]